MSASYTLTLPADDGCCGEALTTNGSGLLTWASAGGGTSVCGTTDNAILTFVNCGSTFAAEADLTYDGACLTVAANIVLGGATSTTSKLIQFHDTGGAEWDLEYRGGGMNFSEQGVAHYRLHIKDGGDIVGTHGTYHTSSDERTKENIIDSNVGLSILTQMRPVKFNFLESRGLGTGTRIGFIAQEIEALIPEVVHTALGPTAEFPGSFDEIPNLKAIEDMQLIPVLVKAIQEVNAKVDAL